MPLTSKGKKIMSRMRKQYGAEKAKEIFYAMINEGKLKGVEEASKPKQKSKSKKKRKK